MSVDVSSPAVDPVPQHEGVAATGAPRARKRTEAGLASPPPIAQARRGGPGPSPVQPRAARTALEAMGFRVRRLLVGFC